MPHLYDIDSDNTPIKHTQFKHDSVQDAMRVAQGECDGKISWAYKGINKDQAIIHGMIDNETIYQRVE
jgi:hypothetical protein